MEENKKIKISLRTAMILVFIMMFILGIYFIFSKIDIIEESGSSTMLLKKYKNKEYYIIKSDYNKEYDLQFLHFTNEKDVNDIKVKKVMNYIEYKAYCNKWGIKEKYSDSNKKYIVFSYIEKGVPILKSRLADVKYNDNKINLYIWDSFSGYTADISGYVLIIPTDKKVEKINITPVYTESEYEKIKNSRMVYDPSEATVYKPIIYLYPKTNTEVSVKLLKEKSITCSYPKYKEEWKVLAKPNGELKDLFTNRNLYSLYYENETNVDFKIENEGFVVKGEDAIKFLEEKLEILGLNEREAEEFIIYWLPKLENNKYNYIRFANIEEINENMPLEINPRPDAIIRILMTFKKLEKPIDVTIQRLEKNNRKGFAVVEWGGTEIK